MLQMSSRREYFANIMVNNLKICKIIIDPHYEKKHSSSISDFLILQLVRKLDGKNFLPVATDGNYKYFVLEMILLEKKYYRMIWLTEEGKNYIGVINVFRRS